MTNCGTASPTRWIGPATVRQWVEWAGLAGVVIAAAALVWFREEFSNAQLVVSWMALVALLLFLLRAGWVRLFGPVLFYDLVRNARRARTYLTRCGYLLLLLFFLVTVVGPKFPSYRGGAARAIGQSSREMARLAEEFFATFMGVQFCLAVFLTPAYVAGAITEEKERKTLEFLLATDLDSREIVLGKLAARVGYLTLLLLTGLPVLSAVQLLGGVEPSFIFAGFAATALTVASLSGMSILASVYTNRSRNAILLTYLLAILYCGLCVLVFLAMRSRIFRDYGSFLGSGPTFDEFVIPFLDGNPIFALGRVFDEDPGQLQSRLASVLLHYAIFHSFVALSTITLAVWRLRPLVLRESAVSKAKLKQRAGNREVSDPPMIWKETHFGGGTGLRLGNLLVVGLGVILSFAPVPYLAQASNRSTDFFREVEMARDFNVYVRIVGTLVAGMSLLAVAVRGSIAIRLERDKDTLDALLTSPLTTREILFGKWVGCLREMRWPAVWLGAIYLIGMVTGGLSPFAVPLLAAAIAVYAGTLAVVGLWFSAVCKTTVRAIVATVSATLGLSVGHWLLWLCCIPLGAGGGSGRGLVDIAIMQVGITPPLVVGGVLPFSADQLRQIGPELGGREEVRELALATVVGTAAWIVLGLIWWTLLLDRFLRDTNRSDTTYPEKRVRRPFQDPASDAASP